MKNFHFFIVGLCQMGGNLVGAFVVDKVGRKTLLYISSAFLAFAQSGLGTYFYFQLNSLEVAAILENYRSFLYRFFKGRFPTVTEVTELVQLEWISMTSLKAY